MIMGCVYYITVYWMIPPLWILWAKGLSPNIPQYYTKQRKLPRNEIFGEVPFWKGLFFSKRTFLCFGHLSWPSKGWKSASKGWKKPSGLDPSEPKGLFFYKSTFLGRPGVRASGRPDFGGFNTFTKLRYTHPNAQPASQIMQAFPWLLFEPCMPPKWTDWKGTHSKR